MSDYPEIGEGVYTWHPIVSMPILLRKMQGCMDKKPEGEQIARRRAIYHAKLAEVAPRIVEMRKQGMSWQQTADTLGCALSTLGVWNRDIRRLGIGVKNEQ